MVAHYRTEAGMRASELKRYHQRISIDANNSCRHDKALSYFESAMKDADLLDELQRARLQAALGRCVMYSALDVAAASADDKKDEPLKGTVEGARAAKLLEAGLVSFLKLDPN